MSTKKPIAEKAQGLSFDQSQDKLFEVWGVSQTVAEKVKARFALFEEETMQEICAQLTSNDVDKGLVDAYRDNKGYGDLSVQQVDQKIHEILGNQATKSGAIENFLESQLFKGIGWTPKTPNDFFVLGWLTGDYYASDKLKQSLSGLVDILKKAVKH